MDCVVDYSFSRPAAADIAAAGYLGVMRYLAPLPNKKVIDAAERDALFAAGLSIGLVWESTANRALRGAAAGGQDAVAANRQADDLGHPRNRPIYYAVDFDADPHDVIPYFQGIAAAGGRPVGGYGSQRVVDSLFELGLIEFVWQTVAWSRGRVSTNAHLYQKVGYVLGNTSDENECRRADWGQWPAPTSIPAPTSEEDDVKAKTVLLSDGTLLAVAPPFRWHIPDEPTRDVGVFLGWWDPAPTSPSPQNVQDAALTLKDAGALR